MKLLLYTLSGERRAEVNEGYLTVEEREMFHAASRA